MKSTWFVAVCFVATIVGSSLAQAQMVPKSVLELSKNFANGAIIDKRFANGPLDANARYYEVNEGGFVVYGTLEPCMTWDDLVPFSTTAKVYSITKVGETYSYSAKDDPLSGIRVAVVAQTTCNPPKQGVVYTCGTEGAVSERILDASCSPLAHDKHRFVCSVPVDTLWEEGSGMALLGKSATEKINRLRSPEFQLKLAFLAFPIVGPTVSGTLDSKGVTKEQKGVFTPINTLLSNLNQHDQDHDMVADAWDSCPNLANTAQVENDCNKGFSQLVNLSSGDSTTPRLSEAADGFVVQIQYANSFDPASVSKLVFNGVLADGVVLDQMLRSADGNPLRLEVIHNGKVSFLSTTCEANVNWPTTIACSVTAKDFAQVVGKSEQQILDIFAKHEDESFQIAIRSGTNLACKGCSGPLLTPKQWGGPEINNTIKAPDNSDANKYKLNKKIIPLK